MKTLSLIFSLLIASFASAHSYQELRSTAEDSTQFLRSLTSYGDQTIPTNLLNKAQCIATLPGVVRAGVIVGAEYGRGLVSCRITAGGWSSPAFISITGGSWGLQLGAKTSDIVLIFTRSNSFEHFLNGSFKLDGDLSLTAGPIGRNAKEGTDYDSKFAVFSYSRSQGLFGGLTIDGGILQSNPDDNIVIYGTNVDTRVLLTSRNRTADVLSPYTDTLMSLAP